MVQIYQAKNPLGEALAAIAESTSQGIQDFAKRRTERKQRESEATILGDILSNAYGEDFDVEAFKQQAANVRDPSAIANAVSSAQKEKRSRADIEAEIEDLQKYTDAPIRNINTLRRMAQEKRSKEEKLLEKREKQAIESKSVSELQKELGTEISDLATLRKMAEQKYKAQVTPAKAPAESTFSKELAKGDAEWLESAIPQVSAMERAESTLKELEKTASQYYPISGWGSVVGLEGDTKLRTLSGTLIKPVVDLLAPSGPIAREKFKWINETYTPKGSDSKPDRLAKIEGLRLFQQDAREIANRLRQLQEKYPDGNFPQEEVRKIRFQGTQLLNKYAPETENFKVTEFVNQEKVARGAVPTEDEFRETLTMELNSGVIDQATHDRRLQKYLKKYGKK